MRRRFFLKLIGVVVIAPSLPVPAKFVLETPWFMYRGHKFRKDVTQKPFGECIQIYTELEIRGKRYCNAVLIDKDDYKYRDMYLDNMIHGIERMKRKLQKAHPVPLQAPERPVEA